MTDAIEMMIEPRDRAVGSGRVRRLLPYAKRRMVGPFIFCDLIGPEVVGPGFELNIDAHPHIGLSTLTYLTSGRMRHRDSTGADQVIQRGDVNWMTAGAGVAHTERSLAEDTDRSLEVEGAQCWVALPDGAEDGPASFEHAAAATIPIVRRAGTTVEVAVGSGFGERSPVTGSSPLILALVTLDDGSVNLGADHPERAVIALDDGVSISGTPLRAGHLAVIERASTPLLDGRGRVLVLGGEPVGKRHIWWNFVHSDPEAIDDAKQRWSEQRFALVPGDHDPYVPLPGDS